jgi:hypothetical protein
MSGINTARQVVADLGLPQQIPSFKPADIPPLAV